MSTAIIRTDPVQGEMPLLFSAASPDVKSALRRVRTVALTSDQVVDVLERLRQLEAENARLAELLQHCRRHSEHPDCGYRQMGSAQQLLFAEITGRGAHDHVPDPAPDPVPARACIATPDAAWRSCEFCNCRTNARERICCQSGCAADRQRWDRPAS
jgi:hypothetical protein